jgi:two-component system, LytTR family, response regulator
VDGKIRTVIAAAEPAALWALRHHAGREPNLDIVAECLDGDSAIEAITSMEPDLLLLDLDRPVAEEFEVLARVSVEQEPVVLLVAGENSEPLNALETAPSETLVKPFDRERFQQAIRRASDKVYRRREGGEAPRSLPRWAISAATEGAAPGYPDRLLVRDQQEIAVLPVMAIRWVESARNYVRLHAQDRTYVMRMALSELDNLLDPNMFARVHRTTIVNVNCISSFRHLASSAYLVTLDDGTELRMSRMYSRAVLSSYYLGGVRA